MDDSDKGRFALAIGAMLETFGQEATKARLHGYWLGLRSLPIESVEEAVARVLETCGDKFPPPPAKLRETASGGSTEDMAISAWNDVQKAIPLGPYRHVDFQDRVINATIRSLGGWPAMFDRLVDADSEHWYRVGFLKAYAALRRSGVDGEVSRPLAGLSEAQVCDGRLIQPVPKRIGCDPVRLIEVKDRETVEPLRLASQRLPAVTFQQVPAS